MNRLRRWTRAAKDCYFLGCVCSKCPIYENYFKGKPYKCKMKFSVLELVRLYGIPEREKTIDEECEC